MANKVRLIDANALLEEMDKFANPMPNQSGYEFLRGIATAITEIEEATTVDAVVLPCEIGREVFYIWSVIDDNGVENFTDSIGKIVNFSIQKDGIWAYCQYEDGLTFWHKVLNDFGRVVFLTREEAETALAKMDGERTTTE